MPVTTPSRIAAQRWCLAWLLAALVCAQALGFMHRIVHAGHGGHPARAGAQAQAHAEPHGHALAADDRAGAPGGWIAALFSAHADESGCRLFDGVGQPALSLPAAPSMPVLLPGDARLRLLAGEFVARWAALFDARGPPVSR